MPIVLGAEPENSFATPIGLLSDCHRRIEKFLWQLIVLTDQARQSAACPDVSATLTDPQRQSLHTALRYFREAAPRHTRDEEESLFPRMRSCQNEAVQLALTALDALEADHDRADSAHADVERIGRKWLAEGALAPEEMAALEALLRDLRTLYQRHILIEDTQIFPLARHILDASAIAEIGAEMAERRGIDLSKLPDLKLRCPTRRSPPQEPK